MIITEKQIVSLGSQIPLHVTVPQRLPSKTAGETVLTQLIYLIFVHVCASGYTGAGIQGVTVLAWLLQGQFGEMMLCLP